MQATLRILRLQPVGRELAIVWDDGHESYLGLEELRRACPCAVCNGEPDVLGRGEIPAKHHTPASFELAGLGFVGGYGLQPRWADGHASGIYSFRLLRTLDASGPPPR